MKRPSKKWMRIAEVYKIFAQHYNECSSFDDIAAMEMFLYESQGGILEYDSIRSDGLFNGYAIGKHMLDITLKMWKEDIKARLLTKDELFSDTIFPPWWLERTLSKI